MDVVKDPQFWTQLVVFIGVVTVLLRQFGARIDARFDAVDRRFDEVDRRFDLQDAVVKERFAHQEKTMDIRFGALDRRVEALEDDMKLVKKHLIPPAA
ncbi:hypothetical protein F0U44_04875 [Nocardioides humilatus]|uniref:Uncharacterized protein n=1 Tax=Nocardioides humilatus TaxID=2607660 RepID=A0A5B1LM38_9ACTN|nr:hypothetical protein [Nocardioides humilatus]KAA1421613.1 hypothetical protein F0U44_04875 [Nocardioides humilatus]